MKKRNEVAIDKKACELNTTSFLPTDEYLHWYKNEAKKVLCVTDTRGYDQPDNQSIIEIVLDASDGFIPLWDKNVILNWRFDKSFGSYFKDGEAAKQGVRKLFGQAIANWGAACPVKFREDDQVWDFEITMHEEKCNANGCVLASAFFPGPGQSIFYIYPTMFKQSPQEQLETIEHEMGHVFGLRHFFAKISETKWKSELFGEHNPFSIMNYGEKSMLMPADINDLQHLYELVWNGTLTEINGTPVKKFVSYHMAV